MNKNHSFEEFHIEGNYREVIRELDSTNIAYLMKESTPIITNSKKKALNIVLLNQRESILKFLDIIISANVNLKKEGQKEIKIYNNHWNFANRNQINYPYFVEFYLEGDNISFFGELQRNQIKYIVSHVRYPIDAHTAAAYIVIHQEDIETFFEILKKANEKNKSKGYQETKIMKIVNEKFSEKVILNHQDSKENPPTKNHFNDYLIIHKERKIYYNSLLNKINVYENQNSKAVVQMSFFKNEAKTELEKEITRIVDEFLDELEQQRTLKKA